MLKTYRSLQSSLSMFHFGLFSMSMSFMIGGVIKIIVFDKALISNEMSNLSLELLLLYLLTPISKMGVLLVHSIKEDFLWGSWSSLNWAKYSVIDSIAGLMLSLLFLVCIDRWGIALDNAVIYPSLIILLINTGILIYESRK